MYLWLGWKLPRVHERVEVALVVCSPVHFPALRGGDDVIHAAATVPRHLLPSRQDNLMLWLQVAGT